MKFLTLSVFFFGFGLGGLLGVAPFGPSHWVTFWGLLCMLGMIASALVISKSGSDDEQQYRGHVPPRQMPTRRHDD